MSPRLSVFIAPPFHWIPAPMWVVLILFCGVTDRACAQTARETLDKFTASVQSELAKTRAQPTTRKPYPSDPVRALLSQLRALRVDGESPQISAALHQLSAYLDAEPLRQQCEDLAAQFAREQEAKEAATLAKIEESIGNASSVVSEAKKPADLDGVLKNLQQLREQPQIRRSASAAAPGFSQRLEGAIHFVTQWQDYLSAVVARDSAAARQALESMSRSTQPGLLPRSEIIGRLRQPLPVTGSRAPSERTIEEIVGDIKTLDEVSDAIRALTEMNRRNGSRTDEEIESPLRILWTLEKPYRDFKAGLTTNVDLALVDPPLYRQALGPLRRQLELLVLPRYLELPPGAEPKLGEDTGSFLDRIATEATKRSDYLLTARAREIRELLNGGDGRGNPIRHQARLFITAQRQEEAKQYALAVVAYEQALGTGANVVPAKLIGERLAAIKAEHPREFEEGLLRYSSPNASRERYGGHLSGLPIQSFLNPMTSTSSIVVPGGPTPPVPTPAATP